MPRLAHLALAAAVLSACSGSDDSPNDRVPADSAAAEVLVDTGAAIADSAADETATVDSAVADTGADTLVDTGVDAVVTTDADSGACHGGNFGAPAATIVGVTTLPTMTGGTIEPGVYDATAVRTTGTATGSYRATWTFSATSIDALEQLALSDMPVPPVPRTLTWSTSGASLTRTQVCGGSASFTNPFTVRTEGGKTLLDIRSDVVMFTFTKR